jgi:hypothetical protein
MELSDAKGCDMLREYMTPEANHLISTMLSMFLNKGSKITDNPLLRKHLNIDNLPLKTQDVVMSVVMAQFEKVMNKRVPTKAIKNLALPDGVHLRTYIEKKRVVMVAFSFLSVSALQYGAVIYDGAFERRDVKSIKLLHLSTALSRLRHYPVNMDVPYQMLFRTKVKQQVVIVGEEVFRKWLRTCLYRRGVQEFPCSCNSYY